MFSSKFLFAATAALSMMVDSASAEAVGADCWFDDSCSVVLENGDGQCLLPPQSAYPLDPANYPIAYLMGAPPHFCGNRKSLLEDNAAARIEALQYCFAIGAKSACIWGECDDVLFPNNCIITPPGTWGDPHFRTWTGEVFDYHGVCDLKYLESKSHNVTIHIRTTQKYHYSFISSAVLEVNGETLELGGYGAVITNGFYEFDDNDLPKTIGGHPLFLEVSNKKTHTYWIEFEDGSGIEMKSFKDMVGIRLIGNRQLWADSVGLMGNPLTGQKLARDGVTVMDNLNEFGQEWQVQEGEKMLFNGVRQPQAPATCIMPTDQTLLNARRLGESMARTEAEEACKNWGMNKEACISDVMVSGDVELAANVFN